MWGVFLELAVGVFLDLAVGVFLELYVLGWRDGGRRVATYFFLFYYLYSWASML